MPLPVVLDTDIGTDIDDAYALVLAATSAELDLRAVTTVNNDTRLRAAIALKVLRALGRGDVPVAVGASDSLTPGERRGWGGHEGQGIDVSGIGDAEFVVEAAPALIARKAEEAHALGAPLTVIPIGALTNLALAVEHYPREMRLVRGIVCMGATWEGWGAENACGEHNIACDPVAAERVLDSGLPISFVGLNVTCRTWLDRAWVDAMAEGGGPLAQALAGMHRVWFRHIGADKSPMHDGLAVAASFRPDIVRFDAASARLAQEGPAGAVIFERPGNGHPANCRVAVDVDVDAFHGLLCERVLKAARNAERRPI